jgi:ABC-type antimicrobial peptide transport system permease subunit
MVLRDALGMVGGGILLGLPCAYAVAVVLKAALFRLEPLDLPTMVLSCSTLLGVALVAAWVPGRRAARIDPVTALREE